jgi:TRAP-type transport system periplasmic protein
MALGLEHQAADKLKTIGVSVVDKVDKSGFQKLADPYLDKLAGELGPHASKIKDLIAGVR